MKQKKAKKVKSNSDTILLIVENSEADFFNSYFKKYLKDEYNISIKCVSSGSSNKCEILNFRKMTNKINEALNNELYKAVFLMLDLKTNCSLTNQNHTCLVKLKNEYESKYKIEQRVKNQFHLFIVCNEIESWFLTINKNTNNISEDHKKELIKLLEVNCEPQIVQKMIKELSSGKYVLDFSKNDSLEYFIKKIKNIEGVE